MSLFRRRPSAAPPSGGGLPPDDTVPGTGSADAPEIAAPDRPVEANIGLALDPDATIRAARRARAESMPVSPREAAKQRLAVLSCPAMPERVDAKTLSLDIWRDVKAFHHEYPALLSGTAPAWNPKDAVPGGDIDVLAKPPIAACGPLWTKELVSRQAFELVYVDARTDDGKAALAGTRGIINHEKGTITVPMPGQTGVPARPEAPGQSACPALPSVDSLVKTILHETCHRLARKGHILELSTPEWVGRHVAFGLAGGGLVATAITGSAIAGLPVGLLAELSAGFPASLAFMGAGVGVTMWLEKRRLRLYRHEEIAVELAANAVFNRLGFGRGLMQESKNYVAQYLSMFPPKERKHVLEVAVRHAASLASSEIAEVGEAIKRAQVKESLGLGPGPSQSRRALGWADL